MPLNLQTLVPQGDNTFQLTLPSRAVGEPQRVVTFRLSTISDNAHAERIVTALDVLATSGRTNPVTAIFLDKLAGKDIRIVADLAEFQSRIGSGPLDPAYGWADQTRNVMFIDPLNYNAPGPDNLATFNQVFNITIHEVLHIGGVHHDPGPRGAANADDPFFADVLRIFFGGMPASVPDPAGGPNPARPGTFENLGERTQNINTSEPTTDFAFHEILTERPQDPPPGDPPPGEGPYAPAAGEPYGDAPTRLSPIVLDLDGDGIELISLAESKAFFDLDNDGFA
jgi:hypothetical protein